MTEWTAGLAIPVSLNDVTTDQDIANATMLPSAGEEATDADTLQRRLKLLSAQYVMEKRNSIALAGHLESLQHSSGGITSMQWDELQAV